MNNTNYIPLITVLCKRLSDLVLAMIGLLLTIPILPFIALAIKLDSQGPVFFQQLRIGKASEDHIVLFNMIKFRTMVVDAEENCGAVWAKKKDSRITLVGNFLRKTRIDELPQFINVLKGEMSMIGPRPERPGFYQKLENNIPFFCERTYGLAPGITGLAQVNQGYDTSIEDVRSKVNFDHSYGLALSSFITWIKVDISIIFKTIAVMLMGRGQ